MNLSWLGHSCFKIEEKINGNQVTVIADPYDKSIGLKIGRPKADIVTISHAHPGHSAVDVVSGIEFDQPLVFDRPGEYESKGVFMQGIGAYHDDSEGAKLGKTTMYRFDVGGITILHLGDLGTLLSDQQLEKIGDIDILLVPVGGKTTLDAKGAAEVVKQVDPRIVIPMHYKIDGLVGDYASVDAFKKEMGFKGEVLPKYKIAKKDLPIDTTEVVLLNVEE